MIDDPIVAEVHRVREEIARQFGHDLRAYGRFLQDWERRHPGGTTVLSPRPVPVNGSPRSGAITGGTRPEAESAP
jgi:hypothetical protein